MPRSICYVVITPVRDEEKYIGFTIHSMVKQTVLPKEWIIVNDGSSDKTGEIIEEAASEYPWIKPLHRKDRGSRKAGGGVIEAFYDGHSRIESRDWDFIVKLDGDLSFEPNYFECCLDKFDRDPKLGVGGGMVYSLINGKLIWEPHPMFHVRGATKIYKRECWDAIGGLIFAPGWDTLDEVKANMLGWETTTFEKLKITQHRFTGAADGSWRDAKKNGLSDYICGYHPLWMLAKCLKRVWKEPLILGALGHLYGFLGGYVKRIPQVDDPSLIRYLRQQQLKRLLFRSSIWR